MNKVKEMLEQLHDELRQNRQYSAADKLLPIIEEAKKDGWTPCSEGMPEEPEYGCGSYDGYIVQCSHIYEPFSAYWDGKVFSDECDKTLEGIIAWQPLPEPYKEQR